MAPTWGLKARIWTRIGAAACNVYKEGHFEGAEPVRSTNFSLNPSLELRPPGDDDGDNDNDANDDSDDDTDDDADDDHGGADDDDDADDLTK